MTVIYITTYLRAGDEITELSAHRMFDEAKAHIEAKWAEYQNERHGDNDASKQKPVWHNGGSELVWCQEEDDGDGDNQTFAVVPLTLPDNDLGFVHHPPSTEVPEDMYLIVAYTPSGGDWLGAAFGMTTPLTSTTCDTKEQWEGLREKAAADGRKLS